jgi:hypothetical protein
MAQIGEAMRKLLLIFVLVQLSLVLDLSQALSSEGDGRERIVKKKVIVKREVSPKDMTQKELAAKGLGLTDEVLSKLSPEQVYNLLEVRLKNGSRTNLDGILVPMFFFICIALVLWLFQFYRGRRSQELHKTIRTMIEKGVEIPNQLLQPEKPLRSTSGYFQKGVLLVGFGLGLGLFLGMIEDAPKNVWTLAFIPIFVGLALVIIWRVEKRAKG